MALAVLFFLLCASHFPQSLSLNPNPNPAKPKTNITVIGSVFCDPCSENTFSKHSYFLPGVQVLIQCRFAVRSKASDEITVRAERTTDGFGVYKLDIPPVEGFQCKKGLEIRSMCSASLVQSSSRSCSVPGEQSSTAHMAVKSDARDICFLNLNTLNYHPLKRDDALCGADTSKVATKIKDSFCFRPVFPPFGRSNLPFCLP